MVARFSFAGLLMAVLLLATSAFANCDSGETQIRFGTINDANFAARNRAANLLKEAVNREMQGKACMEVLVDDDKYKGANVLAALKLGEIEMTAPDFALLSEIAPSFGVFDLPFAFRDLYAVERFQALAVVTLAQDLRSEGLHALGFWHERMKQMTGKIPLVVPQNAAGLKFRDDGRTPPGLFNSLKATAKPVAENDLLNALKTGQVEAQVTAWDSLAEDKTVTVQAGATETNHGFEGYQLLAASAWWDKLDPASAKTLLEIINRINRQSNFDTVQRQTNAKRAVMRSGAAVLALTWEHRASWRLAVQPVWNEFANQTLLDMVAKADQAL